MSSEVPRFVLSSLTLAQPRGSHRLHSRRFTLFSRGFSLLLLSGLYLAPSLDLQGGLVTRCLLMLAVVGIATLAWFRPTAVVASPKGLVVGSGKRQRFIPWARVLDVREVPWVASPPCWYPRLWQVDLDRDERFDFYGARNAREIVVELWKRSQERASE